MFKRIDHVEIIPSDLERTIAFYSEVLGFSMEERMSIDSPPITELAFLRLGDTVLELISVTNPRPVSKEGYQVGYKRMALEVDDMEDAVNYLKTKGVTITRGPISSGASVRAEFEDPDGLSIELRQRSKK